MYFVPLIYFSALTYYFWLKNRTFDLAVYISTLFTVTSLCCVLMVLGGFMNQRGGGVLVDGWEPSFGLIPTILYCLVEFSNGHFKHAELTVVPGFPDLNVLRTSDFLL